MPLTLFAEEIAADAALPIGAGEFEALMAACGPFARDRRVAVGVSGGADSMALAWLLRRWGEPLALVVDHGLRAESADEAAVTLARLSAMGVPARLLRAEGLQTRRSQGGGLRAGAGLGERARVARYGLLLGACRERGLADLLIAHHRRDQAETVLLRREGGSGPAGLAGMAAIAWRNEARVLRPLLTVAPGRLRATLRQAGVGWVEDPTNRDPATARGRLRQAGVPEVDAASAGWARADAERALAAELGACVSLFPGGYAVVRGTVSEAGLAALIWTVSGRRHPPRRDRVRRLYAAGGGTLWGVRVAGGVVAREAAGVAAAVPAEAGAAWDGRFVVRVAKGGLPAGTTLGAAGPGAGRVAGGGEARGGARQSGRGLPAWVVQSMASLRNGMDLLMVPHLTYRDVGTCPSVRIDYRPSRPLVGAPFACASRKLDDRGMHMGRKHPMSDEVKAMWG